MDVVLFFLSKPKFEMCSLFLVIEVDYSEVYVIIMNDDTTTVRLNGTHRHAVEKSRCVHINLSRECRLNWLFRWILVLEVG